ncbi:MULTISPECIES: glutathione S-transferase N-terminal domain-containing protein [unclassified Psychrobacter]|uniref:glutathione S-transferase N-terminal domain-containing protein n=1 Tax=unclassified Psychrobacter TaxID=196806 RepID=UPI003FD3D523
MIIPNTPLGHTIKSLQATTTMLLRGARGNMGTPKPMQPEKMLVLYEHEACPYSRRVREVMTHLNLDFESRPSPHKGHVYRDELTKRAGKAQVPFLIDDNQDVKLLDSQAIIDHLFAHYSKKGTTPSKYQRAQDDDNATLVNKAASVASMMRGVKADHPKKNDARGKPNEPLHLYGFEASPFCRLVREKLSELEVGYINHSVAREQIQDIGGFGVRLSVGEYQPVKGGKRERLMNEVMHGKLQFPYLVDPNTDTQMYESKDIINYLDEHYG